MSAERSSTFTLITGANRGIGLELARQAAADGRNLILVAHNAATLETAANELKRSVTVHTIAQDLSEPGAAEKVYDRVQALHAEVDCLINDAGFGDHGAFYVLAFSEGLAEELRGSGVTVTALCPPPVNTSFASGAQVAPSSYMATTKTTPAEVARYGYLMMKRGKPVAVYSPLYKFLTGFLVRITPRFGLRRLMHRLNAQGT